MKRKMTLLTAIIAVVCMVTVPAQAQLGGVGKSLKGAAKEAAKETQNVAKEAAVDAKDAAVAASTDAVNAAITAAVVDASKKITAFMDSNNTVLGNDTESAKRLNGLVKSNYSSTGNLSLNYKVYQSDEINILALSDGSIRIYSAMMDALTDDELIAVIATQIGHIENKDTQEILIKVINKDNAAGATSAQVDKLLSLSNDKLGSIVNELLQVPYTKEQNKSADNFAFALLKKNGNSTDGLVSALRKFAEMEAAPASSAEAAKSSKYTKVNSNNDSRALLMQSK